MAKPKKCGLKNCDNVLGPGASKVGFDNQGRNDEVKVCEKHTWMIMTAPRGTWHITPDRELKGIGAKRIII